MDPSRVTTLSKALRRKLLIGATMFTLVAVSMMSSVSAISKKDAILNFVNGCYKPLEGYYGTNVNGTAKQTTLDNTFAALNIIGKLKEPVNNVSYPNWLSIQTSLTELSNTTHGGFRNIPDGDENVLSTYQGIYISKILGISITRAIMNKHADFVLKSQNVNGGFGSSPTTNTSSDIFNTYYALKVLSLTGNSSNLIRNLTIVRNFTLSCREASNVFAGTWNSTDVSIAATYFGIHLYQEFLTAWPDLGGTVNDVRAFISDHKGPSGGFVDPAAGTEPLLSSTYYAVAICRDFAGDIPGGDTMASEWIMSKLNYDGGFIEGSSPLATSSMAATNFAVSALYRISPTLSVLSTDTTWTLSQIAGIVAAVVLIVVIVVLIFAAYIVRKRNRI